MADRGENKSLEQGLSPSLVGGIVLALAAIDFVAQNRGRITIHFLFLTFDARVWVALVITSALAIVASELVGRHLRRSRRKK
ncbi:MAG TPA: hypothetical protein VGZ52_01025 [Acidimicrobiales bacterium]|jgi:hypothetical protein|nr:hypothetical protein [Acidimicrobiales bacterium]